MPAKKKPVRRARARKTTLDQAARRIGKTWKETQAALSSAEATVEKRVKALAKRSGVDTRQAGQAIQAWGQRLERERRKAVKRLEVRLAELQGRARKEKKALTRSVDDAVRRTLAALNIPSRNEVQELTRRVEELSKRIERFRR
ncbi:MAG TPA: phasin family protein [Vicinamibacteria bacterium]